MYLNYFFLKIQALSMYFCDNPSRKVIWKYKPQMKTKPAFHSNKYKWSNQTLRLPFWCSINQAIQLIWSHWLIWCVQAFYQPEQRLIKRNVMGQVLSEIWKSDKEVSSVWYTSTEQFQHTILMVITIGFYLISSFFH